MTLLPLTHDTLKRLGLLGLRTLGQHTHLPLAAVWQQFGRVGKPAHRCSCGEDDRPIIVWCQAPQLTTSIEFELPLTEQERLMSTLGHLASPLLAELRGNLQACGQVRLIVQFEDRSPQERERIFLLPVAEQGREMRTLEQLLVRMKWITPWGSERQQREFGSWPFIRLLFAWAPEDTCFPSFDRPSCSQYNDSCRSPFEYMREKRGGCHGII